MRLVPQEIHDWPPLAWVALCGLESVELRHGPMLEAGQGWACEGAWAGAFGRGDLDQAPIVAGSGVRIRDQEAVFVAPTSTVDRLCSLTDVDGRTLVSNSLLALLAVSGAEVLDPKYPAAVASIARGLTRCRDSIETSAGPLGLTYFHNLAWDGQGLERRPKAQNETELSDFGSYRGFLAGGFAELAANMTDPARRAPLRFLGTLSSGYDGNASTAIAAEAGCAEALCFETTGRGHPDSGVPVAQALEIEPIVIERGAWRSQPEREFYPEVPFLAAGQGSGLIEFYGAHERLRGAVLVTGFYGDSIWNPAWEHLGPEIVRKDASGLGFCEYRLRAGFVNCPPAFWAAREVAQVVGIGRAQEMKPWAVNADYDRPVARRVLEEAGVAGDLFGRQKRAVPKAQPHRSSEFLRPTSNRDYFLWVRRNRGRLGLSPLTGGARLDRLQFRWRDLQLRAHVQLGRLPRANETKAWRRRHRMLRRRLRRPTNLRRFTIRWALERGAQEISPPEASPAATFPAG